AASELEGGWREIEGMARSVSGAEGSPDWAGGGGGHPRRVEPLGRVSCWRRPHRHVVSSGATAARAVWCPPARLRWRSHRRDGDRGLGWVAREHLQIGGGARTPPARNRAEAGAGSGQELLRRRCGQGLAVRPFRRRGREPLLG